MSLIVFPNNLSSLYDVKTLATPIDCRFGLDRFASPTHRDSHANFLFTITFALQYLSTIQNFNSKFLAEIGGHPSRENFLLVLSDNNNDQKIKTKVYKCSSSSVSVQNF